ELDLPSRCGSIRSGQGLGRESQRALSEEISWLPELRVIEEIEELGSHLQPDSLGESHVLHQRDVGIGVMRAIKLVASRVADVSEEIRTKSIAVRRTS